MVQKSPHERHSEAARDDGQDQDVHIARSQLPIRSVQRQQPGAVQVQHLHDQSRGDVAVQVHKLRISRNLGSDFTRSRARVSRHRGQPFHDHGQAGRQVS